MAEIKAIETWAQHLYEHFASQARFEHGQKGTP